MYSTLEPVIWSCDTGQQMPFWQLSILLTIRSPLWKLTKTKVQCRLIIWSMGSMFCDVIYCRYGECMCDHPIPLWANAISHNDHKKWNVSVTCRFLSVYVLCLWGSKPWPFGPPEARYYSTLIVYMYINFTGGMTDLMVSALDPWSSGPGSALCCILGQGILIVPLFP